MNNLNYNEKYSDLQKLEEYKVLNTYQKLMIIEMKIISESLHDISKSLKCNVYDSNLKGEYTERLAGILHDISKSKS